jgi:mycothiol system anti-sigma-R factor
MAEGNCDDTLHELYQFLDGELTDQKRQHIAQHLDACPPCFEAYDFEAELRLVIAAKCREEVPESLLRRIAETIQQSQDGVPQRQE